VTRLTIDPITRLEGHGKIEIQLDDAGEVEHTWFQVPELRGFESFCVGRPVEEMPVLTNRICGVCPEAHHLAAARAADAVYGVEPPRPARLLRELLYSAFMVTDHTTHFYALGGPDLIVGPDAPAAERNILGVIAKVGAQFGSRVIETRRGGHRVIEIIGGRKVHPCTMVPGGLTKGITVDERDEVEAIARAMLEFSQLSLASFEERMQVEGPTRDAVTSDRYRHETYYSGLVDDAGRVAFVDGRVAVLAPDGEAVGSYAPAEYPDWIAEHVEPWTYLKFPYLKRIGWKGFVDGKESGVYCVGPMARLNVASGMATPRAQEAYERLFSTLLPERKGREPVHQRGAMHWARLVEMLYAAERMLELVADPDITSDHVRDVTGQPLGEGVATIEAPRGTLTHHYWTDERGLMTRVNLIVGTTNNHAPIAMSIDRAARDLIHHGVVVNEGLLDRIEMAFRAYDPCFGCATHTLPGEMPLEVTVRNAEGGIVHVVSRDS
jgi:F420-non-reducing hydrogenase large subunit